MRRLLNIRPKRGGRLILGLIPIALGVLTYIGASAARLAANPNDKVLPSFGKMADSFERMAFQVDQVTGRIPLLADTLASLERIGIALAIATLVTLIIGLILGLLPLARASLGPLVATIAVIPPIAILPILMIFLGVGETAKITLIAVGITPLMLRDLAAHVSAIPEEEMVKAQSLGGSTWQIGLRVALPQAMPRLIKALRLSLGPAWVFLIAAEAIASDVGLGYRIFLVRRYLAMDVIIPYVAWISLLAVLIDLGLLWISKKLYPWAHLKGAE
jgi:NitT/TauT family transport system permease protein